MRDDGAARHAICPACGALVEIPSQRSISLWPLVLGLAATLTIVTVGALVLLTGDSGLPAESSEPWLLHGAFWCIVLPLVALVCGRLDCVLASAMAGEVNEIRCAEPQLAPSLRRGTNWIACFLAGPVVPASADLYYWMHCGDPEFLDYAVLAGLLMLTVGYWLFALVELNRRGRHLPTNPTDVLALIHRLGYRSVIASLGASLLVVAHGWLVLGAISNSHRSGGVIGVALLACCWVSGVFWAIVLLRVLGIWCHRARDGIPEPPVDGA
jgi:hypothetical protein